MKTICAKPVQILGRCPAGIALNDEFQIEGMRLENPRGSNICFLAVGQLPIRQGVWQLQAEERIFSHVSCPGCISSLDQENRVVFLLGHADKWELCQLISEYLQLSKGHDEPDEARDLKEQAIRLQGESDYPAATRKMLAALDEFRRSTGL